MTTLFAVVVVVLLLLILLALYDTKDAILALREEFPKLGDIEISLTHIEELLERNRDTKP